jgi:hypothetical protein
VIQFINYWQRGPVCCFVPVICVYCCMVEPPSFVSAWLVVWGKLLIKKSVTNLFWCICWCELVNHNSKILLDTCPETLGFKIYVSVKGQTVSRNCFEDQVLDRFCTNSLFNMPVKGCTEIFYVVRRLVFLQMILKNSVCAPKTSLCLFV